MPTYTSGDGKVGWKAVIGADPIEGVKADSPAHWCVFGLGAPNGNGWTARWD